MPPAQIARLVYSASNGEKYEADIEREETSIGRRDDNQICLFDGLISKYHAIIRKEDDGKYYIRDKNSANGIRINEKTIEPAKMILLNNNDMIEIGPFPLIFLESVVDKSPRIAGVHPAATERIMWAVDMARLIKREQKELRERINAANIKDSAKAAVKAAEPAEVKLTMMQIFVNREASPYGFQDFRTYLKITVFLSKYSIQKKVGISWNALGHIKFSWQGFSNLLC
jgi:pSer/pThr/pTyr-binding forkhead associated (FHA) protein